MTDRVLTFDNTGENLQAKDNINVSALTTALLNFPVGNSLQFLRTNGAGNNHEWVDLEANSLNGGPPDTVLRTNGLNVVEWTDTVSLANIESTTLLVANDVEVSGELNLLGQVLSINGNQGFAGYNLVKNNLNELTWSPNLVANDLNVTNQLQFIGQSGVAGSIIQKNSSNLPTWVPSIRILSHSVESLYEYNQAAPNTIQWVATPLIDTTGSTLFLDVVGRRYYAVNFTGFVRSSVVIQSSSVTDSSVQFILRINTVPVKVADMKASETRIYMEYFGNVTPGSLIDVQHVRLGTATTKLNPSSNLYSYITFDRMY